MSLRQFTYETLKNYPPLQYLVNDRVYQGESLKTATQSTPFIVYRMGNDTTEDLAEQDAYPRRQFFLVYAHDAPADYSRVDDILRLSKQAFREVRVGVEGILQIRFLETSRDLDDPVMGTIMRYMRFQYIMGS